MRTLFLLIVAVSMTGNGDARQLVAGTAEDKMFQQIAGDANFESKLQTLREFEKQFPQSKALPDLYLMFIDLYRDKGDRVKMIEYGEKALKLDERNATVLMVLARNYAMDGKEVDRALELAQRAVERVGEMRAESAPPQYTEAQWNEYLRTTEASARSILQYVRSVKSHKPN